MTLFRLLIGWISFCLTLGAGVSGALADETAPAAESALQLVMFEQHACFYCERWNEEIGISYGKTAEGKRAPLRRVDIHDALPDGLSDFGNIALTPTFVLLSNGEEVGRLPGYLGEDFFWGYLTQLLNEVPES